MEFTDKWQHSLPNLAEIEAELRSERLRPRQLIGLAHRLCSHAHPAAEMMISQLRENTKHPEVLARVELAARFNQVLRSYIKLEELPEDQLRAFYRLGGYIHIRKRQPVTTLLVVFTTMYNNFFMSNAALAAMLGQLDCDLLILKDPSYYNYQRGVAGFADDLPGITAAIQRLVREGGIEKTFVTGFSTTGYAALATSLLLKSDGYVGFSHPTDLSVGSAVPQPHYITPEYRETLNTEWLVDLKPALRRADPTVPRAIFYGERDEPDRAQALHLSDVDHVQVVGVPKASHNTVEWMVAEGKFLPMFASLMA